MQRVITGVVLAVGCVAAILLLPTAGFAALLMVVGALALHELVPMLVPAPKLGIRLVALLGFGITVLLLLADDLAAFLQSPVPSALADDLLLFVLLSLPLLAALTDRSRTIADRARIVPGLGFACVYIGLAVVSALHIHRIDPRLLLVMIACVALGDSAAYYFGTAFGRHRLAPAVSPKKSWEGAVASFLTAAVLGAAAAWWLQRPLEQMLLAAAIASVFGQLGDLLESLIKRAASVKDSGTLLPGHGGVLDRIDALLLAAPPFRLIVEWWA